MADSEKASPQNTQELAKPEAKLGGWGEDYNNDQSPFKKLVEQVQTEFNEAYKAQKGRIDILQKRLKLYNNQRRDPEAVGDNTLFEVFQAVFAALYQDQMSVKFVGRSAGSQDKAESLNNTAKFDYDEMDMSVLDFEWDWDSLFFGYGLMGMNEFDRERMVSSPEIWDPTVTLRDPDAISVNGFRGKGAARYFGREIMIRGVEMMNIPSVFDVKQLKLTRPTRSLYELARQSREDAQGLNNQIRYDEKALGVNARYPLIEWYTWWKDKKLTDDKPVRVLLWLGNDMKKICRFKIIKTPYWPVVHRKLFATSHQWDSVSIPDLIEDKQRLKAVLMNLGVKMMKSDLFGMYIYDKNKIKSKGDLNFDLDKMVAVDLKTNESLQNVVQPMQKNSPNMALFSWIMSALNGYAQLATGTPEAQIGAEMGGKKGKETATKSNQVQAGTAARYSLTTKIWGWSEKEKWKMWYDNYKEHLKPRIDEKLVRINTVFGYQYKFYQRDDIIISDIDPDVFITSKVEAESKQANDRMATMQFGQILAQTPGSNMRYYVKRTGRLSGIPSDEVDRLLPPTPDEIKATYENVDLNEDKFVSIHPDDNHEQHLEIHSKARQTPSSIAHIAMHQHALTLQKTNPEMFPNMQQQLQQTGGIPGQQPGQAQAAGNIGQAFGKAAKGKKGNPGFNPGGISAVQK